MKNKSCFQKRIKTQCAYKKAFRLFWSYQCGIVNHRPCVLLFNATANALEWEYKLQHNDNIVRDTLLCGVWPACLYCTCNNSQCHLWGKGTSDIGYPFDDADVHMEYYQRKLMSSRKYGYFAHHLQHTCAFPDLCFRWCEYSGHFKTVLYLVFIANILQPLEWRVLSALKNHFGNSYDLCGGMPDRIRILVYRVHVKYDCGSTWPGYNSQSIGLFALLLLINPG